mmetsp:Transcript_75349/g.194257  ORF Transcript_75349/g.194257 Transcript_75349/m.194257 type:complete len:92 (-) Transcript_75349:91-366(-)
MWLDRSMRKSAARGNTHNGRSLATLGSDGAMGMAAANFLSKLPIPEVWKITTAVPLPAGDASCLLTLMSRPVSRDGRRLATNAGGHMGAKI